MQTNVITHNYMWAAKCYPELGLKFSELGAKSVGGNYFFRFRHLFLDLGIIANGRGLILKPPF